MSQRSACRRCQTAKESIAWLCVHFTVCDGSTLGRRLMQPLVEANLSELRAADRNQRTLAELRPEVPRVRVDDNLAGIVAGAETLADELVETKLLRTGDFDCAVHRGTHGDPADRRRDVISGHGLKEHRWQSNRRAHRGFISD